MSGPTWLLAIWLCLGVGILAIGAELDLHDRHQTLWILLMGLWLVSVITVIPTSVHALFMLFRSERRRGAAGRLFVSAVLLLVLAGSAFAFSLTLVNPG